MMNPDGTIRCIPEAQIRQLRSAGNIRATKSGTFRDVTGLDERVWQHLLTCADLVRQLEETKP